MLIRNIFIHRNNKLPRRDETLLPRSALYSTSKFLKNIIPETINNFFSPEKRIKYLPTPLILPSSSKPNPSSNPCTIYIHIKPIPYSFSHRFTKVPGKTHGLKKKEPISRPPIKPIFGGLENVFPVRVACGNPWNSNRESLLKVVGPIPSLPPGNRHEKSY